MTEKEKPGKCGLCESRTGDGTGRSIVATLRFRGGAPAGVCGRCVEVCNGILVASKIDIRGPRERSLDRPAPRTPHDIRARIDEDVVGQERAKRVLSVALYNHRKRIEWLERGETGVELQKSNILILGQTGTGKTHLARSIARILDVPFCIGDATKLTQAGYVGEDAEEMVKSLYRASGEDLERTKRGVIYIDEVDKLARRQGRDRDVGGEGVQQALLKLVEGTIARFTVPHMDSVGGRTVEVDTTNILFIAGGAFAGVLGGRPRRPTGGALGFGAAAAGHGSPMELTGRLVEFGMIPEFAGRFPVRAILDPMDEETMVRILTEPRGALVRQYRRLFEMEGGRLDVTDDGLRSLARAAIVRGTGARGLRSVMENLLLDAMFDLPATKGTWVLDAAGVESGDGPRMVDERKRAANS